MPVLFFEVKPGNLVMFCRVSLVRLVFGDIGIFTQPLLIFSSVVYFSWARGANARGTTQERGEALPAVAYLPSLLGFPSRALSFLTLSPLRAQLHFVRKREGSNGSGTARPFP